ncbi:MAG: hypothetical protein OEO79_04730 [Gemmatimonadota bacterium]|nr:hypothetical protein [Gemmatimonadota bacterium]
MKDPTELPPAEHGPRRVQAVVALRLLEVIRDRDLPGEILEDEDPSRTIPRRFGLSDVVERQIRTHKADARKGVRLSDVEVSDLFRFVIRRPDGDQVFEQVGRLLAASETPKRWGRILPKRAQFAIARSATRRRLKRLFGRAIGGFARGPFVIEGRALFFIQADPGGDACHLLSGFCSEVIEQTLGGTVRVAHAQCQSRGDALCRWEAEVIQVSPQLAVPPPSHPPTAEDPAMDQPEIST